MLSPLQVKKARKRNQKIRDLQWNELEALVPQMLSFIRDMQAMTMMHQGVPIIERSETLN